MKKKQNQQFLKYINFLWLILFFTLNSFSQNRASLKKVLNSSAIKNEHKVYKADSLIKVFKKRKSDSLAYIYNDYAFYLFNIVDIDKIIFYAEKALASVQKESPNNISLIQTYAIDLAYYYENNNQTAEAINLYKKIIFYDNSTNKAISSYLQLADIYFYNLKDYYKAKEYYEIAISLLLKSTKSEKLIALRNAYQNLTYACYFIRTSESLKNGTTYGKAADSLAQLIETQSEKKIAIKLGIALSNTEEENLNFDVAFKYNIEALEIAKKTNKASHF